MRMHHVGIVTTDLERSIAFYTSHFGCTVQERGEFDGAPLAFLALEGGVLELVQGENLAEGVVNHVAFAVEDLTGCLERLAAGGVRLLDATPVRIYNGGMIAFCEGPDGELIELIQLPVKKEKPHPYV